MQLQRVNVGKAEVIMRRVFRALRRCKKRSRSFMSSAQAAAGQLHQVVSFLSAALARVQSIRSSASGGSGNEEAAATISSACDALKPQLVRISIVFSAGPASPSTIESFCSASLPHLSALASSAAAVLATTDEVRWRRAFHRKQQNVMRCTGGALSRRAAVCRCAAGAARLVFGNGACSGRVAFQSLPCP